MKNAQKTIFFIGNLDSNLFKMRINQIAKHTKVKNYKVINTSRKKLTSIIKFIIDSFKIILHCLIFSNNKIIFHGAYNVILWILVLIKKNHVISILQGSELEKDYTKFRSFFIKLILKKSKLIVCRNKDQVSFIRNNIDYKINKTIIVNWGLDKKIFNIVKTNFNDSVNIISPRASQIDYNISAIFDAVKKIKNKYSQINFTYVNFNQVIHLKNQEIADKILVSPTQYDLWHELINSDICISIPSYDGLSNTVLESLALGNYLILSDLNSYGFLKNKRFLGDLMKIEQNYEKNVQSLYFLIEKSIKNIIFIRSKFEERREFIKKKFLNKTNFKYMIDIIKG